MLDEKFVVFCIGEEEYAIPISQAKEIINYTFPTRLPLEIEGMLGVINLRGRILPIIDIGKKLGIESKEQLKEKKIIIIRNNNGDFGAVIDKALEIISIPKEDVHKVSSDICNKNKYMIGIAKKGNRLIMLIDLSLL